MMSPIGQYLAEFRPAGVSGIAPPPIEDTPSGSVAIMDGGPDPEDVMALPDRSDAYDAPDGQPPLAEDEEPTSDAWSRPAFDAALDALKAEHAAELASARQHWAESAGTALAAQMTQCFGDLERNLADTLAPMLEPFLAKAAHVKVLDQLRDTIGTLLAGGEQRAVTVTGPEDLIEAIKQAYPGRTTLVFETADEPDVSITMGDTQVRTQLRAWTHTLEAALGAPQ